MLFRLKRRWPLDHSKRRVARGDWLDPLASVGQHHACEVTNETFAAMYLVLDDVGAVGGRQMPAALDDVALNLCAKLMGLVFALCRSSEIPKDPRRNQRHALRHKVDCCSSFVKFLIKY